MVKNDVFCFYWCVRARACVRVCVTNVTRKHQAHSFTFAVYGNRRSSSRMWTALTEKAEEVPPWKIFCLEGGTCNWLSHTVYKDEIATTGRLLRSLLCRLFLVKLYHSIPFSHSPWVLLTKWWVLFWIHLMVFFWHVCKCRPTRHVDQACQTNAKFGTSYYYWSGTSSAHLYCFLGSGFQTSRIR